jgi:dTDP-4-dehydrorhamnose reductase/UDP-glucose 4-epimerase
VRLVLIGASSFIARHVRLVADQRGIDVFPLRHDADIDRALDSNDTVINFALNPSFQSAPYSEKIDFDAKAAMAAARTGAHFVMLSTRRVYPVTHRWGASEHSTANGDETIYGKNKALSEARVTAIPEGRYTVLRLSNIIGFEYELGGPRKTFMAIVLHKLRTTGEITFDMASSTRRDFLPVEVCAGAIVRIAQSREMGVFNVGCGFGVPCGDIANAVLEGFGGGKLVVTNDQLRDEFYLSMDRWNSKFLPLVSSAELISYCERLGRRLRNA